MTGVGGAGIAGTTSDWIKNESIKILLDELFLTLSLELVFREHQREAEPPVQEY